jgi:hypothetical protein
VVRVGVVEQKDELAVAELLLQRGLLRLQLLSELLVVPGQRVQLDQVVGPPLQVVPAGDLAAVLRRLPSESAGQDRILPDARLGQALL